MTTPHPSADQPPPSIERPGKGGRGLRHIRDVLQSIECVRQALSRNRVGEPELPLSPDVAVQMLSRPALRFVVDRDPVNRLPASGIFSDLDPARLLLEVTHRMMPAMKRRTDDALTQGTWKAIPSERESSYADPTRSQDDADLRPGREELLKVVRPLEQAVSGGGAGNSVPIDADVFVMKDAVKVEV